MARLMQNGQMFVHVMSVHVFIMCFLMQNGQMSVHVFSDVE